VLITEFRHNLPFLAAREFNIHSHQHSKHN
jgi:hypothetical protein